MQVNQRLMIGFTLWLLGSTLIASRVSAADDKRPNLVLIVTDDQRPDTLSALGNPSIETPHLDRLVRSGMSFRRAYTGYPICYASRAQILTGCNVFTALESYPRSRIRSELSTLAETLTDAGYRSIYSGKWHNDGNPLQRGYQQISGLYSSGGAKSIIQPDTDSRGRPLTGYRGWTFKDASNQPMLEFGVGLCPDNSQVIGDHAVKAIEAVPEEQPFFIHVNFAFPHDPRMWPEGMEDAYDPSAMKLPNNFRPEHGFDHGNDGGRDELLLPKPLVSEHLKEELAIYYAMITDVDLQVGRILESLEATGRLSNTMFVFTSDQGLALGSHGLLGKQNQYEHSIRSPLVIAGPKGLASFTDPDRDTSPATESKDFSSDWPIGETSDALVELSDLFPTLCDVAGVQIPDTVQGLSLVPLLSGEQTELRQRVYGVFTDTQRMVCGPRWKYVEYPRSGHCQLFDVLSDPEEIVNRVDDVACELIRDELKQQLRDWQVANHDPLLQVPNEDAQPVTASVAAPKPAASQRKTNVVFILTDNQGAWTLGCYGNPDIRTPNIDQLAAGGVRFTRAMSSNPVCSPTRATYLTGLLPSQHGLHSFLDRQYMMGPKAYNTLDEFRSIGEVLSDQGYVCGLSGKWHLGANLKPSEGFSFWVTKPDGSTSEFYDQPIIRDGQVYQEPKYTTDLWTECGIEFIEQNQDQPFFLFLAYNGPYSLGRLMMNSSQNRHAEHYRGMDFKSFPVDRMHPWQHHNKAFHNQQIAMERVAAETSGVDDGVGQIMSALDRLGLAEDTLVIYAADQGWMGGQNGIWGMGDHTRPIGAHDLMMQVPLIFHHRGSISAQRTVDQLVSNYDFMPSLLGYLRIDDQPNAETRSGDQHLKSPGRDYSALLRGEEIHWEDAVFYEMETCRAIRLDRWKFISRFPDGPDELYDLDQDPQERFNLFGQREHQTRVDEMRQRLSDFFEAYADPQYDLWKGGSSKAKRLVPLSE